MTDPTPETTPTRDEAVQFPAYGEMPFAELGSAVKAAQFGAPEPYEFDPEFYPGHQVFGPINFNSLNRIVTWFVKRALATAPAPTSGGVDARADFLRRLRAANVRRDAEYRAKTNGEPLPLLFRTTEFAGEVGELLNVVKKLERERLGWAGKRADRQMLLEEFGGVVATLDLLAMMLDVDLAAAAADEFNAVSDRLSLTTKLATAPAPTSGGVDVEALTYRVANAKLGEGSAVRCEGPTDFEKDQARAWVKRVLRALASLSPATTPGSETGLIHAPGIPTCGPIAPMAEPDLEADFFRMTPSGVHAALAKPASSPAGGDVVEREVAAQAALARIKKLRDQYADQAKFADVDEARLFRQFVERLDRAALSQSTSAGDS